MLPSQCTANPSSVRARLVSAECNCEERCRGRFCLAKFVHYKVDLLDEWEWDEQALVAVAVAEIVVVDSSRLMVSDRCTMLKALRRAVSTWWHNFALRQSQLGSCSQMRAGRSQQHRSTFLRPSFGRPFERLGWSFPFETSSIPRPQAGSFENRIKLSRREWASDVGRIVTVIVSFPVHLF